MIYPYSIANDTLNGEVAPNKLQDEINKSAITIGLVGVTLSGDVLNIEFKVAISGAELTILDGVVAAHDGTPSPDDPSKVQIVNDNSETARVFTNEDRLKIDVIGTLGDGQVRVSGNDGSTAFLENKITNKDNKISVVVLNEGGNEQIEVGIIPSNIPTSELNNDANFIDSAGAPVQPSDIANFETSTQLDGRDTNNRNRDNHTGTQLASSISDFSTAVKASETLTNLNFNPTTNILSYTDEAGTTQNFDLSLYLDDTNLSRIASGSLDSVTGICTFTRDDNSTFTVDFSSLNDQGAINTAISNHETSISNHSDINTSGASTGDVLIWNGSQWVPGGVSKFTASATFQAPRGTQGTSFQQYLRLDFTIPRVGNYKISWRYEWSYNNTQSDFRGRVELNDTLELFTHRQEPQDSGGSGVTVQNITGGTFNSGTDQRFNESGFEIVNFTNTTANFVDLDLCGSVSDNEATIYRATLLIEEL